MHRRFTAYVQGAVAGDKSTKGKLLTYKGRLYDVSSWMVRHPGGPELVERFLGTDATCVLHMCHDMRHKGIQKLLAKMDRGEDPERPLSDFDRDYLELEELFVRKGWFEPSLPWYAYKAACVLALLIGAFAVSSPWLKGLLFGLFIQQSAFIAHDTCHNAAVPKRWRRRVAWLFGTVCFGLSHDKWTREHNVHHMINSRPLEDPQMNTMPHLLYAAREVESFVRDRRPITDWERTKMGFAHLWLLPALFLYGRVNVVRGDLRRAWHARDPHYLWGYALHFGLWALLIAQGWRQPLTHTLILVPVALAVSGLIHLQLILSHAYRPRLFESEQKELGMKLQVVSNQNISTSWLDDWLHGGLQHHIEHHLFPRLPRHSLAKVRPYVRELCQKHGLEYHSDPFPVAVYHLLRSIYREGAPLRAELAAGRKQRATTRGG